MPSPGPAQRPHRRHRPGHRRTAAGLRHRHRTRRGAADRVRQPPRNRLPAVLGRLQARRPPARARRADRRQGHPRDRGAHPCVFATFTAPSFGPVHARRIRGHTVLPCRPRRDAAKRVCPHGRDISCPVRHHPGDRRLGRPLCARLLRLHRRGAVQRLRRGPVAPVHHLPAPQTSPPSPGCPSGACGHWYGSATSRSPSTRPAAWSTSTPSSAWTALRARPRRRLQPTAPGLHRGPAVRRDPPGRRSHQSHRQPGGTASLRSGWASAPRPTRGPSASDLALPGTGGTLSVQAVANYIAKYATKALDAPGIPARPLRTLADLHGAPLLPPLPADDHLRLATRRHPDPGHRPAPAMGPHARLRRPLPDQIPPLLRHLRPAPHRPHRPTAGPRATPKANATPGTGPSTKPPS